MSPSRLLACALSALLLAGPVAAPGTARAQDEPEDEPAAEAGAQTPEAGQAEPEPGRKAERRAKRKAKREAEAGTPADAAEDAPPTPAGGPSAPGEAAPESGSADESASDSESDADSDRPGRLVIHTDAECDVIVQGRLAGRARPDEPLEVAVDLGEIAVRALAVELRSAVWEKTLVMEEAGTEKVRIRMLKAIRTKRREERKIGIFRDPKTRLMWPKADNGFDLDLRRAYAYCRDLETGGLDGWRLPTLAELRSLESIWGREAYKIRGQIALTECCIWSSEYDGSERAWTFNYRFRQAFQTNAGYQIGLRALCVREWPETEAEDAGGGKQDGE